MNDRIQGLCNKVADIKYDLQIVLDELYSIQHELEEQEEQPCDYAANFIRTMSLWLDRRPEIANDGKTIEQLINEYKIASE
mgnify:CR=1 FL=1|jgi:hypothetical protein